MTLFKNRLVNCYFCEGVFDERDCQPADEYNDDDGGSICEECFEKQPHHIEEEIDPGDLDLEDSPPLTDLLAADAAYYLEKGFRQGFAAGRET